MSATDMLAMADAPASDQAQCRGACNQRDLSMLVVVTESGEDVRETVVAANLPNCALGDRQDAKISMLLVTVALSIIECNDLQAPPNRPRISFITLPLHLVRATQLSGSCARKITAQPYVATDFDTSESLFPTVHLFEDVIICD